MLYLPDTDKFDEQVAKLLANLDSKNDLVIFDGTFMTNNGKDRRWRGRGLEGVFHPAIADSMRIIRDLSVKWSVVFTHLNHTNPAVDPNSEEHNWIIGHPNAHVARDGLVWEI